jgi:hypothetical protein
MNISRPIFGVGNGGIGLSKRPEFGKGKCHMIPPENPSPSPQTSKATSVGRLRLFCALFVLIGAGVFYFATVRPVLQGMAANHWEETPCVIDSSKVAPTSHMTHGMRTYRIEMAYHYTFQGTPYHSTRYDFTSGGNTLKEAQQSIVDQYPAGRQTVCYVNPAAPAEAVIHRGVNGDMAFGAQGWLFAWLGFSASIPHLAWRVRRRAKTEVPRAKLREPSGGARLRRVA